MLLTLDTNVIVYTSLDSSKDRKYASEFNEQTSRFLTRTVHEEVIALESRISMFQILLETHRKKGETPKETFGRVGDEISPNLKTKLHRFFNNIVEYYEKEFQKDKTIQEITDSIVYELTRFSNLKDRIRPSSEQLKIKKHKIEACREIIQENDLVDKEDIDIIVEIKLHQEDIGEKIRLITRDSGFNTDREEWRRNFPKIEVQDISS